MNNTENSNLSLISFFMLWFGASISIAEILTGGLLAPIGFKNGLIAILIGHLIGTTILILGGVIGIKEKLPSIMSTRISFGLYGSYLFSILNVMQLIGWTAVMIISGARSVNQITKILWSFDNITVWSLLIGALICFWIVIGKKGWKKLNLIAVSLLFILTIVLSTVVFRNSELFTKIPAGNMTFGTAIELNVIMPLSWLPLIADYTRYAKKKRDGIIGSFAGYFIGSCWMYVIGLGAAIVAENPDPSAMMLAANLGVVALGIIVLSTVTTTFLDAYSAGVTFLNILPKLDERKIAIIMGGIGTIIAVLLPIEQYENFLYAIGSVFAPLFAVLLTDYFIIKKNRKLQDNLLINWGATIVWIIGIILYYQFVKFDFIIGSTVPVMIITSIIYCLSWRVMSGWKYCKKSQDCCQ
ncbi:putative hydroxymethylpyrimidine transporter CytX [Brassicibacter mesophilus]|uniref:putative hydroxymethylpyrimidine transporter CytX n=1 Tax=Brassicibacter mesophilus TaxID=745119 RepID=UPI003D245317